MEKMSSKGEDNDRPSRFKDKMRLAVAGAAMLGAGAVGEAPLTHQSFMKTAEAASMSDREDREVKIFDLSSPEKALGSMQQYIRHYKNEICQHGSAGCIDAFGAGEAHLFRAMMLDKMVAMAGTDQKQKEELRQMRFDAIQLANQRLSEAIEKYTAEKILREEARQTPPELAGRLYKAEK